MVQMTSGILGAVAATLAFGAVHLEVAAGNDLLGPRRLVSSAQDSFQDATLKAADPDEFSVNRAAKTDRADVPAFASAQSMTLSFGIANVPATSIVMRVPVKKAALPSQIKPSAASNSQARNIAPRGARMVACEPSVSLLAPVARQLEPSRCVT
ncbi:MAG TPA: hypothetical protein VGC86_08745 [Afipia sp.]